MFKTQHREYIFHLITVSRAQCTTRNVHNLPFVNQNIIFSKTVFLRLLSLNGINQILAFIIVKVFLHLRKIRPAGNSVYNYHNPKRK